MGAPRLLPPLLALPGCRARERRGREFPFLGRPSGTGAVPRSVREGGNRKAAEKASLLSPCPVIPTEQFFRCVWGSRPPSRLSLFPRAAPSPQRGSPPLLAQTLLRAGLGQRPARGRPSRHRSCPHGPSRAPLLAGKPGAAAAASPRRRGRAGGSAAGAAARGHRGSPSRSGPSPTSAPPAGPISRLPLLGSAEKSAPGREGGSGQPRVGSRQGWDGGGGFPGRLKK